MKKITSLFVAFGVAASFAVAGEGEGCPGQNKGTDAKTTSLATARKAFAEAKATDEKLPADKRAELETAREFLMQTSFGKSMGPSFEACGWLTIAAASQPGTSPEAAALLKDMGATYCTVAKMFGGCAGCEGCEDSEQCSENCKADMSADAVAAKAKTSLDTANKLLAVAKAEQEKMTPEQMEKTQAAFAVLSANCPFMPALQGATTALNDAFASLAKMGIPSTDAKNATRDGLVKAAIEMHGAMTSCSSGEECESTEKTEEAVAPAKSS